MLHATIDFETYSPAGFIWDEKINKFIPPPGAREKGLKSVGTVVYTEHPDAEVLCLAFSIPQIYVTPHLWILSAGLNSHTLVLFEYVRNGGLVESWNAAFEYYVWNNICVPRHGFPPLPANQLRCAMAKARAFGLPGNLADAAKALNTNAKKEARGKSLITTYCVPHNPTKSNPNKRNLLQYEHTELYDYCKQDVLTEIEISSRIPELSEFELRVWQTDQAINRRGVAMDIDAINAAIQTVEGCYEGYNIQMSNITEGEVPTVTALPKLKKWLKARGLEVGSLDKENISLLLKKILPPQVDQVLHLRQKMNSASIKKLYAMKNQLGQDGRLHNLFVYHAARTGRAAGTAIQPQNLPASKYTPELVELALRRLKTDTVFNFLGDNHYPSALGRISGCLRGMFIAAPGHDLISADYKAIEAVVLAQLAGETWRQEVFKTHGRIYEMSASKITGISLAEYIAHKAATGQHHPTRKTIGKIAELASGFGGWIGAWKQFGADEFFTDEEIKQHILAWRAASPAIVEFWGGQFRNGYPEYYGVEGAAIQAVINPGSQIVFRDIKFLVNQDILTITLPSGRPMVYHQPLLARSTRPRKEHTLELSYCGWNTNPKNGATGWQRLQTYGGRLTENIVQGVARDILVQAILNLEQSGYPVVLHVHDEIVSEIPETRGSLEEFEKIMSTLPSWASDWPIKATGGWRAKRYQK